MGEMEAFLRYFLVEKNGGDAPQTAINRIAEYSRESIHRVAIKGNEIARI